eukprot:10405816-Ditylum_brightwellii.AAC.1
MKDSLHFEERQASFEESNIKIFLEDNNSHFSLKDCFNTFFKLIDGGDLAINDWNVKLWDGKAESTMNLCEDTSDNGKDDSSSSCSNYLSAYRGTAGLKKKKRRK